MNTYGFHVFLFRVFIDADTVAHHVYRPGSVVLDQIAQEFGSDLLLPVVVVEKDENDTKQEQSNSDAPSSSTSVMMMLDRTKLGSIVFADPQAMTVGQEKTSTRKGKCFKSCVTHPRRGLVQNT
jgi:dephospho-CoA kinase